MAAPEGCRFIWYECGTTDAALAKGFYSNLFGWQTADVPMPWGEGSYTLFKMDGRDIAGLYQMSGPQFEGVPPHWMTYVHVESADDSARKAESLGGKTIVPPMDVPGVGRIAFLEDPTGAHIALLEPREHSGTAPPPGPKPGIFGWSELATHDTEAAEKFYTQLFSWGTRPDEKMGYTEWLLGETSIGGLMKLTEQHGDAPPHWLPYVTVEDCLITAAKAKELGGSIIVPPMQIPDVGTFSVFADPAGAVLAVVQLSQ